MIGAPLDESRNANAAICVGCGLCCDGTLHPSANIDADEADAARAAGFSLVQMAGGLCFQQPCPKFSEGSCTIYLARPSTCRTYRCKMLKSVDDGHVLPAFARDKISTAIALRDAVVRNDPSAATFHGRREAWNWLTLQLSAAPISEREAIGQRILAIAVLEKFLAQWFKSPSS